MEKRIISTEILTEDAKIENSLRPLKLDDYVGQEKVKRNLKVYIKAAKERGDSLDHVLFYGPPGLGKTTLAGIIANEMGVNIKVTSGPAIENLEKWLQYSIILVREIYCSLMRYTDLTDRLRKYCIQQWKIMRLI